MRYKCNYPQLVRESGFKIRQYRDGPLDWRLMGSYETERILREQNLELIDSALQHLSEAPLGTVLETHILDSGIAKYFVMSQYAIQYLLYCRTFLDETMGDLREAHATAQLEITQLRKSLAESNAEIVNLNKKITQIEAIREVVYPCHLCTKNFISNESLNIHIGRKHGVGHNRMETSSGATNVNTGKDKDNDMQLINAIKMELEIKQLKERLNAAERNIKERNPTCSSSKKHSPREESKQSTVRSVGIQSNLVEPKEKDELNSEALDSEDSERKEQFHGLMERISHFETWQTQLKESNNQFISDINQKLEFLTRSLEQSRQRSEDHAAEAKTMTTEERMSTPCVDDLERILTEKVSEIGKASANKLEEVVYHLEMGYKDKLEALERELKRMSVRNDPVTTQNGVSKIPKPVPKKQETNIERIKRQVEREFVNTKHDDDTYSVEEPLKKSEQKKTDAKAQPSQSASSGSQQTYTKSPADVIEINGQSDHKFNTTRLDVHEVTDVSESLSETESASGEGAQLFHRDPEPDIFEPAIKSATKDKSIQLAKQPLTRKDARKLINRKLSPHGFDVKSKSISHASLKRINADLTEQRNKLKLQYPNFYATRNRIRKFVEKLCSTKLPERAEVLLKHKTPLQPMERPRQRTILPSNTRDDSVALETKNEESSENSHSSSPEMQQQRAFKEKLNQILIHPPQVRAVDAFDKHSNSLINAYQTVAKPAPLPRKRVMFNTMANDKTFDDTDVNLKE